jgi:hypothetical protein
LRILPLCTIHPSIHQKQEDDVQQPEKNCLACGGDRIIVGSAGGE